MNIRQLVKSLVPRQLFIRIEPYGHWVEAVLANCRYGFPARGLQVIGVTGTDGKTTTSFLIHRMLHESGYKVGLMTTVGYGVGENIKPQIHHMTTVNATALMRRIKAMRQEGIQWLVLETTSHALAQYRVWHIPYSVAVMTNVTHEHLDYHRTFERYRDAKRKLFQMTDRNRHGLKVGIINAEDPSAALFSSDVTHPILYGIKKGEVQAREVRLETNGVRYNVKTANHTLHIHCRLPGSFNVANSLAAVCVGIALGVDDRQIEKGIAALEGVEGRMNTIDEGQNFTLIVDFAHTPDSFKKLFQDIRPVVKGKLIVMFGSAGRRDEAKRAVQGRIAGEYADTVIVTEEDDRDVDGLQIMSQIAEGAKQSGKTEGLDLLLIHDRSEAIQTAVKLAQKGDTVLLLGKGHEKTIERADGEHPWDEIGSAHRALKQRLQTDI